MKLKIDYLAILASIIILYCNGGLLSFIKGSSIVTYMIYGILLLWFFLAILKNKKFIIKYLNVSFVLIFFYALLNILLRISSSNVIGIMSRMNKNLLFLLMFVAIFVYYSDPSKKSGRSIIVSTWFIDTILSSIYTVHRLNNMSTLSRILATESPEMYLESGVSIAGVFGFGSIYGLIFVIVALIGIRIKMKKGHKISLISIILLFAFTIIKAQFFIASVLCVLGIIMTLLFNEKIDRKKILFFIFACPLILFILLYIINELLPYLVSSGVLPKFISNRLMMFLNGISFVEFLETSRGLYYLKSVNAIFKSFGLGAILIDGIVTGGHSEVLDLFAIYGIPLATLFLCGILCVRKYIFHSIPNSYQRNYNITWLLFFLMSCFNTSLWCQTTMIVFLIIPLLYINFIQTNFDD